MRTTKESRENRKRAINLNKLYEELRKKLVKNDRPQTNKKKLANLNTVTCGVRTHLTSPAKVFRTRSSMGISDGCITPEAPPQYKQQQQQQKKAADDGLHSSDGMRSE